MDRTDTPFSATRRLILQGAGAVALVGLGNIPFVSAALAAANDKLYVSLLQENKIREYDASSGQPTGREFSIPAPVGLTRLDAAALRPAGHEAGPGYL